MPESESAPTWTLVALFGSWLFWLVTFPGVEGMQDPSTAAGIGGILVLVGIPLLWFDAREAIRANELEVSRPIYVVLAVYVLYLLLLPVYVGFRVYKSRQSTTSPDPVTE